MSPTSIHQKNKECRRPLSVWKRQLHNELRSLTVSINERQIERLQCEWPTFVCIVAVYDHDWAIKMVVLPQYNQHKMTFGIFSVSVYTLQQQHIYFQVSTLVAGLINSWSAIATLSRQTINSLITHRHPGAERWNRRMCKYAIRPAHAKSKNVAASPWNNAITLWHLLP